MNRNKMQTDGRTWMPKPDPRPGPDRAIKKGDTSVSPFSCMPLILIPAQDERLRLGESRVRRVSYRALKTILRLA